MKYKVFLFVFVIGLISSIIITTNPSTGICAPGQGCSIVNSSPYASLFGIKNSVYGIFIFSFMILLTLFHINNPSRHTRNIIHAAVIIGSLISLYFLFIQIFVIKAICEFCLLVDFGLLVGLVFLIYLWDH
ncbi:MAG: vitamin K epoxide reductase family protein [Candidatus Pacearchaeota archaeon]|jgi:uncharacterized membrane protein